MLAIAAFPDRHEVGLVDHPEPVLEGATDVLVQTLEVGVCGTDAELCAFHFGYPPAGEDYLVLGHEALGRVVAVGPEVRGLAPGDLVVPSVRRPCPDPECAACHSRNQDYCLTGEYTERGIFGAHGFLAERFVESERFLYGLPASLREVGVLTEPLTIAEKGLRQLLAIRRRLPWLAEAPDEEVLRGCRAVVLGAGPVGILGAMLLRQRGCEVTVYSREPADSGRAELLRATGSRYLSAENLPVERMAEEVGGIDLVYEAAGSASLTLQVVQSMAPNGTFILTGATGGGGRLELGADALLNDMVGGNLVIAGTVNASRADFESAIRDLEIFLQSWPEAVRGMITSHHRPEEFAARAADRDGIKQVIDLDPSR